MLRVLVTRPEPEAGRTARALEALGHRPLVLPLSRICAVPVEEAMAIDHADAVAVTSANALRHAEPALIARLADLPCHAVGPRTAAAARDAGFIHVVEGPGDAEMLARRIAGALAGKRLAYLCGRVRYLLFEERLAAAGVHVNPVETYDTIVMDHPSETVAALLEQRPLDAMLLYSAKAAKAARRLAERPELAALLGRAEVLALSARVAQAYDPAAASRIRIAPTPAEPALLALLAELH